MKKLVIPLLVGIVAAGTLTLAVPQQAGASTPGAGYCTVAQTPTSYASSEAGKTVLQLAKKGQRELTASGVAQCSSGPEPHVSFFPGSAPLTWGVTFSHNEINGALWKLAALGVLGEAAYLCGLIPIPFFATQALCIGGVAFVGYLLNEYVAAASSQVQWLTAWTCSPSAWSCNIPGSRYVYPAPQSPFLGYWQYPTWISGLNVLFAFPIFPIGLQVNPAAPQ